MLLTMKPTVLIPCLLVTININILSDVQGLNTSASGHFAARRKPRKLRRTEVHQNSYGSETVDDKTYRSPQGLGCESYSWLSCRSLSLVGFSKREVDDLLLSCPDSCNDPKYDDSVREAPKSVASISDTSIDSLPDVVEGSPGLRRKMQGISMQEKCENVDDPEYTSPQGLRCDKHAAYSCFMFQFVGFSPYDLYRLVNSCPVSCNVACGTYTLAPSASPSALPTISAKPSYLPSASPTSQPSAWPSTTPSSIPSSAPSKAPTTPPFVTTSKFQILAITLCGAAGLAVVLMVNAIVVKKWRMRKIADQGLPAANGV